MDMLMNTLVMILLCCFYFVCGSVVLHNLNGTAQLHSYMYYCTMGEFEVKCLAPLSVFAIIMITDFVQC